jgi:hypothetical protein
MESKYLPIDRNPGLSTECYHNCRLSILKSHDRFLPWVHSHFTNLKILVEDPKQFPMIRFEEHLDIYSEILIEQPLKKGVSWVNTIKTNIDKDQYTLLFLNWKYIRGSKYFNGAVDVIHEALIFGYNDKNQSFLCLGFDVNGKAFGEFELPYCECDGYVEDIIENHLYQKRWFAYYGFPISTLHVNPSFNPKFDVTALFFALDRSKAITHDVTAKGGFANGYFVPYFMFLYIRQLEQGLSLEDSEHTLWNINIYKMIQHKKFNIDMMHFISKKTSNNKIIGRLIEFHIDTRKELLKVRGLSLKYQKTKRKEILQEIGTGFLTIYEFEKRINAMLKDYLVEEKMDNFS